MKKIWFFTLFFLFLAGCGTQSPELSPLTYNNELIALQESAVNAAKSYYSSLNTAYDGENLMSLYTGLQQELASFKEQAVLFSGYGSDYTLRDAVVEYISGMQDLFEKYEKPTVALLVNYSGSAEHFYQQDQQKIASGVLEIAPALVQLDEKIELVQARFSQRHHFQLP